MASSPFDELESSAPSTTEKEVAGSPFAELEEAPVSAPEQEASSASPFQELESSEVSGEEEKPARYQSVEDYPGQHEDLKRINAISLKEVKEIAQRNGVPWEDVRSIAPYYRVGVEEQAGQGTPITDDMKKAVGYLSSAGMDLPIWVAKKASSPEMRAAMDDLSGLAETRKSGVVRAGEMASGLLLPVGGAGKGIVEAGEAALKMPGFFGAVGTVGKEVGKQAGIGAGLGAVGGLAASREGEELPGLAKGAAVGGVVGGALGSSGRTGSRSSRRD